VALELLKQVTRIAVLCTGILYSDDTHITAEMMSVLTVLCQMTSTDTSKLQQAGRYS
jgi:hypothetical protein